MKKIIYICNTRFPTEKAHGLSTAKLCDAFVQNGYSVDLIIPKIWNHDFDIFSHYKLKNIFTVKRLPCVDFLHLLSIPSLEFMTFLIQMLSFSIYAYFYILIKYDKNTRDSAVFMSHDYIPLFFASFVSRKIFYDIHHFPGKNLMYKHIMKKGFGFSVQTKWKKEEISNSFGIDKDKIVYWPNGTDIDIFSSPMDRLEARRLLSLSDKHNIAVYTGQLFSWKGVDTLINSIEFTPDNVHVYLVGGSKNDVENIRNNTKYGKSTRIHYIDFQPHEMIRIWMKAADVLILPNTGKQKVSLYYTSPMKLFEYMASGRPIIASAIPSIMEILNDDNSALFVPDNSKSLGEAICKLIEDTKISEKIASKALKDSVQYSWNNRARKIIKYIDENI